MKLLFHTRILTFVKLLIFVCVWHGDGVASEDSSEQSSPSFFPPLSSTSNSHVIKCEYPDMKGWIYGNQKKSDWLRRVRPGDGINEYNILTDNDKFVPRGVTRKVESITTRQYNYFAYRRFPV